MKAFTEGQEKRIRERVAQVLDESLRSDSLLRGVIMGADETSHVVNIGTSILSTKWGIGYPGGSFVQAVVDNDLTGAFSRADYINRNSLGFYCKLLYNIGYID
jgi:hypothetical protein